MVSALRVAEIMDRRLCWLGTLLAKRIKVMITIKSSSLGLPEAEFRLSQKLH
jgi:hypothetical protein